VPRRGVDTAFEREEGRKSSLLLEAQRLRQLVQDEAAAARFAEAAEIEESLAHQCEGQNLIEKALIHRFSAASCWAQAGNFYRSLDLCAALLAHPKLPPGLRNRVEEYSRVIRSRRSSWYAELASLAASES
jgi:hypothetical protein